MKKKTKNEKQNYASIVNAFLKHEREKVNVQFHSRTIHTRECNSSVQRAYAVAALRFSLLLLLMVSVVKITQVTMYITLVNNVCNTIKRQYI